MALDDETGGDGVPIEDNGPEWGSVEEERDYWKGLAQSYAAKLMMVNRTMQATWRIEERNGRFFAVSDDCPNEVDVSVLHRDLRL